MHALHQRKLNQENCPRFTLMATDHHNFNISEHWSNATQNNNFFFENTENKNLNN